MSGLKAMFDTMKNEGLVIAPLEKYLFSLNDKDADRAVDVNAPSAVLTCARSRYYARMKYQSDGSTIDARTRRIFDNGTSTHERLQGYMKKEGSLIMDEVPLRNDQFNIQGHTDGLYMISDDEAVILEIKSINDRGFSSLKDAKEEHKSQATVYLYCAEVRRRELKSTYLTYKDFKKSILKRRSYYASLYQHLKDGRKYTRKQKIKFQCGLHEKADDILYNLNKPLNKVVVLYENKNSQELKEFCVEWNDERVDTILEDYADLNRHIAMKKIPKRWGTSKSCTTCRWCHYKIECWN